MVGVRYLLGDGVEKNEPEAIRWLTKAAELGHGSSSNRLEKIVMKNHLLSAAEQGDAEAQFEIAEVYYYGAENDMVGRFFDPNEMPVKQDMVEAARWYTKAAEQGYIKSQLQLGLRYENGDGVAENPAEATRWLTKVAEQGDESTQSEAKFHLKRIEKVVKHLALAQQGDADAQFSLGKRYGIGSGVGENPAKEAIKWYTKAAEQGNVDAQYELGEMYNYGYDPMDFIGARGEGVKDDKAEAIKWYTKIIKAAEQGDANAQYYLGEMYNSGAGVKKNKAESVKCYAKALKSYTKAAEQGDANAQFMLGEMYSEGLGVKKNNAVAFKWHTKAAEQGDVTAQFHIGYLYETGKGVKKNKAEAVKWYTKALEQGDGGAKFRLDEIAKNSKQ
jgi:TPR repeat protein